LLYQTNQPPNLNPGKGISCGNIYPAMAIFTFGASHIFRGIPNLIENQQAFSFLGRRESRPDPAG
jgi:hypothetical protein